MSIAPRAPGMSEPPRVIAACDKIVLDVLQNLSCMERPFHANLIIYMDMAWTWSDLKVLERSVGTIQH